MGDLMLVHMVLAGCWTIFHHQILLLLCPVPLCPILRIAMLHHQYAPSSCWCGVVGEARRLLGHRNRWQRRGHKSPPIRCSGSVPHAQVAAAAVDAALLRATVVVADAFGGGAPQLLKVLGQGGISQVAGWWGTQSAEFVVRRLKTRMEEGRVKVISVDRNRKGDTNTNTNKCSESTREFCPDTDYM